MVTTNVDIGRRYQPISIAFLIDTANSFNCDIFVECGVSKINVKNYDELKDRLVIKDKYLLFYFNGEDELDAENRIQQIFQP